MTELNLAVGGCFFFEGTAKFNLPISFYIWILARDYSI